MILDFLGDLNWAAVGVALVAGFGIGMLWFAPPVFGAFWARQVSLYTGVPASEISEGAEQPPALAKWLVGFAAIAVVLALAVQATGTDSAGDGAVLGVVLGIGLGSTLSSWPPIFARMPWAWWLLNNCAYAVMLAVMGAILGAWR